MNDQLISIYQKYCNYTINDGIQLLDFQIDSDRIQQEILTFIVKNQFGFNSVSLRISQESINNQDYISEYENVRKTGIDLCSTTPKIAENTQDNAMYLHWHPDLENSYTQGLVDELENLSGFKIGRVRLAWLMPYDGYSMHVDLEPMRLHIPLITNKYSYFIEDDNIYHMEYGNLYHIITTSTHTAHNFGNFPRLHLVFSTYSPNLENDIAQIFTLEHYDDLYYSSLTELNELAISTLAKLTLFDQKNKSNSLIKSIKDLINYRSK